MFAINVTVDFLDYLITKLMSVGLPKSLMQVHDITHHLGKKSNRLGCLFLFDRNLFLGLKNSKKKDS
jgi:hypothetical protein